MLTSGCLAYADTGLHLGPLMFLPGNTEWFYLNIDSRKLQTGDGKGELCQLVVKETTGPQPLAPGHIVTHDDTIVSGHSCSGLVS